MSLAGSAWELAAALFVFGMTGGSLNVSMNTHAVSVEEGYGRPIMGSFHAFWSAGAMTGSAVGGWAAGQGITPLPHFGLTGLLFLIVMLSAISVLHLPAHAAAPPKLSLRIPRAVAGLGLIACAISVVEGAMADWGALYLEQVVLTGAGIAALGFSCYAAAMIVARVFGDRITLWLGRAKLVRSGSLLAFAGLSLALLARSAPVALTGFAIVGLGVATIIPNVFGAAGRVASLPSGVGMAAVTTMAYMGFLGGPPLIGALAEWLGLRLALLTVLTCLLTAAAASRALPQR
jgi:MFS family permease